MSATLLQRSRPAASLIRLKMESIRLASSIPTIVRASKQEASTGQLSSRNLETAVRSIHEDGLVVISEVIPHAQLDALNAKMISDTTYLQSLGDAGPYNYNKGNIQQDPPPLREHFNANIMLNSIATQITSSVLGPRPKWTFCSGNTAVKGPEPQRQPVHTDADFAHPSHPFALVVNVPLITFTPENGSTEIWLGTHTGELAGLQVQDGLHGDRASGKIKQRLVDERAKVRGPSQPVVEKGSIVIRDLRLWHAGMPNYTDETRIMIALIHFAPWYRNPMKLELAESLRPAIEAQQDVEVPANWVSSEVARERYLNRGFGNSYDFDQTP